MGAWSTPLETVRRLVGREDCMIFDVGANVGDMSELFRTMFSRSTIHAFEPQPAVFDVLTKRFGATEGVVLNRLALGEQAGEAVLYQNNNHQTSSLLPLHLDSSWVKELKLDTSLAIPVPVDTIDRYCEREGIAGIDYLKLDVQGFEPECLRGAVEMLSRRAVRVIQVEITTHRAYGRRTTFLDVESVLVPRGYRLYSMIELIGNQLGELLFVDAVYVLEAEFP